MPRRTIITQKRRPPQHFFPDNPLSASRRVSAAELLDISEKFVRLKWSARIDDEFVQHIAFKASCLNAEKVFSGTHEGFRFSFLK